jgi:hypothetical protein
MGNVCKIFMVAFVQDPVAAVIFVELIEYFCYILIYCPN